MSVARYVRNWHRYKWIDWALLALITAYFLRGWLQAGVPVSSRLEMLPGLSFAGRVRLQLEQGRLFYEWDPYEFAGYPWARFLSFPLYFTVGALSALTGLSLQIIMVALFLVAFALSAVAMYEWIYSATGRRNASLVGGLIYGIFPYHLHMGVEWWEHALFWAILPLPYVLYERGRSYMDCGLGGETVASERMIYSPHWIWMGFVVGLYPVVNIDRTVVSVICLIAYIAVREFLALVHRRHRLGKVVLSLALSVLVSAGVAACVLVPASIELPYVGLHLKRGTASLVSDELLTEYAVSPRLLLNAILRRLHLSVSTANLPEVWDAFGGFNAWYLGLVALGLSVLGLLRFRRSSVAAFAGLLWIFGLLVAMGPRVPVNPLKIVPLLGTLRFQPHRGLMLTALAEAMLAAQGVIWIGERLSSGNPKGQHRWWFSVLSLLLLGLIVLDFRPGGSVFRTRPAYFHADEKEAYRWLSKQGEGFRIWEYALAPWNQYLYTLGILEAPIPRFWGYYDNGAPLHTFCLFNWGDQATKLNLSAVRYILFRPDVPGHLEAAEDLKRLGYNRIAWQSEHMLILENSRESPYVRVYTRSALYIGDQQTGGLDLLPSVLDRGVALIHGSSAYLEDYKAEDLSRYDYLLLAEALERAPGTRSKIERIVADRIAETPERVASYPQAAYGDAFAALEPRLIEGGTGPEVIRVMVDASRPLVLMVSESWYPNWRVYIDGKRGEVLRVNYAFLGTWVGPGKHRIEFRYVKPWYTALSYAISGVTLVLFLGWVIMHTKRRLPRG